MTDEVEFYVATTEDGFALTCKHWYGKLYLCAGDVLRIQHGELPVEIEITIT